VSILEVILLGALQGITEFLPVSSSGHLVLLETLFGLKSDTSEMLLFDLAVHLGTVIAVVIVFVQSLVGSRTGGVAVFDAGRSEPADASRPLSAWRLLAMILVATIATGILVMPVKASFERARGSLAVIGVMWVITGTLLWIADRQKHSRFDLGQFGLKGAFLVGLAQGVAVMPGISRSGATICAAILLGLYRVRAVQFSLLIGIPAVLGASFVESLDKLETLRSGSLPVGYLLLGAAVAAVVGVGAIHLLIRFAKAAKFKYFGLYCYALAVVAILYSALHS
jgi:undecaprenyl-diphosphatase